MEPSHIIVKILFNGTNGHVQTALGTILIFVMKMFLELDLTIPTKSYQFRDFSA